MTRLELVAKDIAVKLNSSSLDKIRIASIVACQLALDEVLISNVYVINAFDQLKRDGSLPTDVIDKLNEIVLSLDDQYFELQESFDDNVREKALILFMQARAVSAISFAAGDEIVTSSMESIYEASAAVTDVDGLFEKVMQVLA
jgi:hypothetical protein